jgi:hypothetical protein
MIADMLVLLFMHHEHVGYRLSSRSLSHWPLGRTFGTVWTNDRHVPP